MELGLELEMSPGLIWLSCRWKRPTNKRRTVSIHNRSSVNLETHLKNSISGGSRWSLFVRSKTYCATSFMHALHLQHLVRTWSEWRPWTTHRTSTIRYVYGKQWVKWCIRRWWFNLWRHDTTNALILVTSSEAAIQPSHPCVWWWSSQNAVCLVCERSHAHMDVQTIRSSKCKWTVDIPPTLHITRSRDDDLTYRWIVHPLLSRDPE